MNTRTLVAAASTLLLAVGCDGGAAEDAGELDAGSDAADSVDAFVAPDAWAPPVPDVTIEAANAVGPESALFEGQQRFLYDTWGTERLDDWPPAEWMLALMTTEPGVFGNQYESFGFTPDPNDDFPVGFKRGIEDPTRVHETCALCHVGELPDGRLWMGAPSARLDWAGFRAAVSARWEAEGHAPLLTPTQVDKAPDYGPGRFAAESTDYPVAVPADFPPYWYLGARTHMNYLGTGGDARSEIFLSVFTFGAGAPDARRARVPFPAPARIDPFIAFMSALASPEPAAVDPTLVASGRVIFERARCAECHHVDDVSMNGVTTYDSAVAGRERFPGDETAFPRGSIRTSYLHRILIDGEPDAGVMGPDSGVDAGSGGDDGYADLLRFITANRLHVAASDGYRVSDLHGLWATAPYLHNGSVPTLADLLRPAAERPTSFMRGDFLVDTSMPGNSNQGHEFGTSITEEERTALVAYLESL